MCSITWTKSSDSLPVPVLCHPAHFPTSVYPFTSYDECFGTLLSSGEMRNIWASYLMGSDTTGSNPLVSPLLGDFKDLPPHYLFVAGQDPNRDEAIAYARKLKEAGVDGDITVYPGVPHEFAEFEELETTRMFRRDLMKMVGRMVKG
jgi:acetyl esterase